jgi:DNA-binding transcriptional MerR regulator
MTGIRMGALMTDNVEFFAEEPALSPDRIVLPQPNRGADRMTIGEFAREAGVTLRALRFYQSKGLLAPVRDGAARIYSRVDRERLAIVLQGKRLGFTLSEIRDMVAARGRGCAKALPMSRKKCVEQINLLEHQRRDIDHALVELRQIYTGLFISPEVLIASAALDAKMP